MNQPIYELEIVNEIMKLIGKVDVGFYQKEFQEKHAEISKIINDFYANIRCFAEINYKNRHERNNSLHFCQGEQLIPLLEKIKAENIEYYELAVDQILKYFFITYDMKYIKNEDSFLEQLFSWAGQVILTCKEVNGKYPTKDDLKGIFRQKLEMMIEEQKIYKK